MAHLPKLPTFYVKDGKRIAVFFTVKARELMADGWVEETEQSVEEVVEPKGKLPEVVVEAGQDAFDFDSTKVYPEEEGDEDLTSLEDLTKAELLDLAQAKDLEVKPYATKGEILKALMKD